MPCLNQEVSSQQSSSQQSAVSSQQSAVSSQKISQPIKIPSITPVNFRMRFIKLGLISFVFLALLFTVISLFIPSHIRISRAINIKAEKDSIIGQIKDAAGWKNWYPGLDTAKLLYENGVVKGVVLDDKDPGHPVYIHINKEEPDEVSAEFINKKMRPVINGWRTFSYSTNDSVTLQWYMDFNLRWYPWEKFSSLLLESSYGAKMEKGLYNLKKLLEAN